MESSLPLSQDSEEMQDSEALSNLVSRFVVTRVLAFNSQTKTLNVLGTIDGSDAVISLEKSAFHWKGPKFKIGSIVSAVKQINHNDVYYWSNGLLTQSLNNSPGVKLNLTWPATATHIAKFETKDCHFVSETPEMYATIVAPYIATMRGDRIQWVRNILHHGKESESVVLRDDDPLEGYVLLPDMKWDGLTMKSMYLVAIVLRDDIASLRDLNESHIPWLESLARTFRTKVPQAYPGRVASDELRIFVHYQPSYYHFHIHIVHIAHPGLGDGIAAGKAVLLEDVIEQLRWLGAGGFKNKTMGYVMSEGHDLWPLFQAASS